MINTSTAALQWEKLAPGDTTESVLPARPFQLINLWDIMLRFNAHWFFYSVTRLDYSMQQLWKAHAKRGDQSTPTADEVGSIREHLPRIQEQAEGLDLVHTQRRIHDIWLILDLMQLGEVGTQPKHGSVGELLRAAESLRRALLDDINGHLFIYLPAAEAEYYEQEAPFGITVKDRFPEANKEIILACNCYATGSYTASVFHLTRAVEIAARVMVARLQVPKASLPRDLQNKPVKLCTWEQLITILQTGVDIKKANTGRNEKRKASFEFYNHAVSQFRNFKDAWRNKVAHKRRTYQAGEAKDIMNNVRLFMNHISQVLREPKGSTFD